jgi:valyl-tRNA synthetase
VKFYENGDSPLEIVGTRQWYLRNGGRDQGLREELLELGRELRWVPDHMRHRYEHWVGGLTGDWLISRQRFFGVPFPVWYRLDDDGQPRYGDPLVPGEDRLPVDPSSDVPDGWTEAQRGQPGGFVADPDVMDTWATSSLTPQIVGGWERDPDLFARVFPMDLRPQSHEIIRTWLFATVVRARAEHGVLPWHTAVIAGWILDPDRKKMSKSKGNALTPDHLLDQFGSDAVRYWAACGRPGVDLAFDPGQFKVGRRLATKLLNASRFVLGLGGTASNRPVDRPTARPADVTRPLDRALTARLAGVVATATRALEEYDHTAALVATEAFFWQFCDDYLELVKERAYGQGPGADSARAALRSALETLLRLFAPFLPYVTEEVWSWWRTGSVHRAGWPVPDAAGADGGRSAVEPPPARAAAGSDSDGEVLTAAATVLSAVRRAKSERSLSLRVEVPSATVSGPAEQLAFVAAAADDLRAAGRISDLRLTPAPGSALSVACDL